MSDLKRKYDGLKQAHKELSEEVVGLREKVEELEKDDTRKWDMMNADGVTLDHYRTRLEGLEGACKFVVDYINSTGPTNTEERYILHVIGEAIKEADNG